MWKNVNISLFVGVHFANLQEKLIQGKLPYCSSSSDAQAQPTH
ncbi:hypothetical protein Goshw_014658, partial [Gossypium schwendimanii]|nr:hypothetical protein [Gossypium schwendimanii]